MIPEVRRASAADAAALARFAAAAFTDAFGADNTPEDLAVHLATSYGEARQRAEIADPQMATLLLDHQGSIAGFAQLRRGPAPPCVGDPLPVELWRFYVDRAWHGTGTAQRLMGAVLEAARELGGGSVWLSVWEQNPRAIAFYGKCGFRDAGTKLFLVGTDRQTDRVMVRLLPETSAV